MNGSGIVKLIMMITVASLCLCACEEDAAPKSSFGEGDVLTDGEVLIGDTSEEEQSEGEESANEPTTSASTIKTSKRLDLEMLPAPVKRMAGLCDAINIACVDQRTAYNADDPEFVWHCVHMYVVNSTDKDMGFKRVDSLVDAEPNVVTQVIYAMFGKLSKIPQIPYDIETEGTDGPIPHIQISNDLRYRFLRVDRGISAPDIRRVTQYSDGSMEMEVALVDSESGEETVSFIYSMRANTRDTTTSALFDYEITGVRPADKITSDKMSGMPFLVQVIQTYGYDSYSRDDPKYDEVVEVMQFSSFVPDDKEMEKLNKRISDEVMEYVNRPLDDVSWHEICSYPITNYDYVQLAVTMATYPSYAKDPGIRCYNYSKDEQRALDENDAYRLCDTTAEKLAEHVRSLWKPGSETEILTDITYEGFIVRADGSVDMYYTVNVDNTDAEPYSRLIVYNSGTDGLRIVFDGYGIVPEDEEDAVKPKLTHGKKE